MTRTTPQMTNRRRVLAATSGLIAGAGLSGSVAASSHWGDHHWDAELFITQDGLIAGYADVQQEQKPDSVTIHTAHDYSETFTDTDYGWYGYQYEYPSQQISQGWHGQITEVEATHGSVTLSYSVDDLGGVESTCSLWNYEHSVHDLRVDMENAHKMYDGPVGEEPVFGSPGRQLQSVNEIGAYYVEFEPCEPEDELAVVFDCDEVTIHPEEFVNGHPYFYQPQLRFEDDSSQWLADESETFEPPVTLSGTGEHAGKTIAGVSVYNDPYGDAMFGYTNPDVSACDIDRTNGNGTPMPTITEEPSTSSERTPTTPNPTETSVSGTNREGFAKSPTPTDTATTQSSSDESETQATTATETFTPTESTTPQSAAFNSTNGQQSDDEAQASVGFLGGVVTVGAFAYFLRRFGGRETEESA